MEVARMNDISVVNAYCGGVCACATCRVYVDEPLARQEGLKCVVY